MDISYLHQTMNYELLEFFHTKAMVFGHILGIENGVGKTRENGGNRMNQEARHDRNRKTAKLLLYIRHNKT